MKESTRSYKYSCRDCTIRQRCIDAKNLAPSIKTAVAQRFENHTDTFGTWDLLQHDCLLVREEQPRTGAIRETSLLKRLRDARQPSSEPSPVKPQPTAPQARRVSAAFPPPTQRPPASKATKKPCGIKVISSQRMVRLPGEGEVVLGRFEHGFSRPPDVDLAFDDGEIPSVSRRHALVIGRNNRHWIEDMGSTNGTYLNGHQLSLGESVQLASSDRILLGRCRLVYTPLPDWALGPDPNIAHAPILIVTHTGHQLELPDRSEMLMGRPDPSVNYAPDVDLSVAGEISMYVARRHARLVTHGGKHFLQEAGSAAGTRLNGRPIQVGDQPVLLHPGDQIWLGGCVVAYEWRLL